MAAPTFIQEAETAWNPSVSVSSRTTPSFTVQVGDVLMAVGGTEDQPRTLSISSSGGGVIWTLAQKVNVANYSRAIAWTGTVTSAGSMTVTVTCSANNVAFG